MMYKLINKTTGEEHLCDKVTIDGFDYYVSNEEININNIYAYNTVLNTVIFLDESLDFYTYLNDTKKVWFKVIATTNPGIDIPKVVNEGAKSAKEQQEFELETGRTLEAALCIKMGFLLGYKKSQETHPNSDEDVKSYLNFVEDNYHYHSSGWYDRDSDENITREQMFINWKEQKIKTIYYE